MPAALAVTSASFKGLLEGLGKLATAKPYAENAALVTDLMEKVSTMYGEYEAMAEGQAALKAELASLKDFAREKERYASNNEDSGVVTYLLKEPSDDGERQHRFCPNCFLNRKISYLQPTTKTEYDSRRDGRYRIHHCHSCGQHLAYQFKPDPPVQTHYSGGSVF